MNTYTLQHKPVSFQARTFKTVGEYVAQKSTIKPQDVSDVLEQQKKSMDEAAKSVENTARDLEKYNAPFKQQFRDALGQLLIKPTTLPYSSYSELGMKSVPRGELVDPFMQFSNADRTFNCVRIMNFPLVECSTFDERKLLNDLGKEAPAPYMPALYFKEDKTTLLEKNYKPSDVCTVLCDQTFDHLDDFDIDAEFFDRLKENIMATESYLSDMLEGARSNKSQKDFLGSVFSVFKKDDSFEKGLEEFLATMPANSDAHEVNFRKALFKEGYETKDLNGIKTLLCKVNIAKCIMSTADADNEILAKQPAKQPYCTLDEITRYDDECNDNCSEPSLHKYEDFIQNYSDAYANALELSNQATLDSTTAQSLEILKNNVLLKYTKPQQLIEEADALFKKEGLNKQSIFLYTQAQALNKALLNNNPYQEAKILEKVGDCFRVYVESNPSETKKDKWTALTHAASKYKEAAKVLAERAKHPDNSPKQTGLKIKMAQVEEKLKQVKGAY